MSQPEFVSEPITPQHGSFDASAMGRGEPGLPAGFTWRDRQYRIVKLLASWKHVEASDHAGGDRYYRKHYFEVLTDSGERMTIYAVRHTKTGESRKKRWWLYSIDRDDPA